MPWVVARDEEQLHRKISELAEDKALRLETGRKAREYMEKYWTERHAIKVLLNLYEELPTEK